MLHFIAVKTTEKRALQFANYEAISRVTGQKIFSKNITVLFIRVSILVVIILALTGTTLISTGRSSDFDFVLAIDASSSMAADDFNPNRLEAAKEAANEFIDLISAQTNIGLITFSGTSFIETELTNDLSKVRNLIRGIEIKRVGGTDLGESIITSSNLLLKSENAKIVILLTDGQSNVGVPLKEAIDYANQNEIIIHTIGVATEEGGTLPGLEDIGLRLDETSLINIASSTRGVYFRALDKDSLLAAYEEISTFTIRRISTDLTLLFMITAFLLLFIEWLLSTKKFRILP
tara:strand:+ start:7239 stop:8111 length:873 start_codon:yes stop_codon:yes gene_type:complete